MDTELITIDPDIHGGTLVFRNTRVPIKTLFDHLEAGDSLEVFLDDFPSVSRQLETQVLARIAMGYRGAFSICLTSSINAKRHRPFGVGGGGWR